MGFAAVILSSKSKLPLAFETILPILDQFHCLNYLAAIGASYTAVPEFARGIAVITIHLGATQAVVLDWVHNVP
jgi:hypothetical protein